MQSGSNLLVIIIFLLSTVFTGCQTKEQGEPERGDQNKIYPDSGIVVKVTHYPSGAVETETEYVNGVRNGTQIMYDEEGNVVSEAKFVDNKMEGELKSYFPDGSLKVLAPYEKGLLHGEVLTFFPDGKIFRKQTYDQGKLILTKQYTPDGKLEFEDKL